MSRTDKREKFTNSSGSGGGAKLYFIIGLIGIIVIAAAAYFYTNNSPSGADASLYNAGAVSYEGQTLRMNKVTADISGGKVTVDLQAIKDKKMVTFDLPGKSFTLNNGTKFDALPVLAYVSPQGNVVAATSLCEPCSGTSFRIEGDQLVCNACDTRWTLDGLQGISGGCLQYPPETVKYTVEGNKLVIDEALLKNWQPRPL